HLDRPVLEVTGSIPVAAPPETRTVAVVNPTVFYAESARSALVARGITIGGPAVDYDDVAAELIPGEGGVADPMPVSVIATTQSPPLPDMPSFLMKVSKNLYAETLLKAVGAARSGLGTTEAGRVIVRNVLTGWGVPSDSYVMYDGSGLSRYNYVTAATLTSLLEHMYGDPAHREAFVAT